MDTVVSRRKVKDGSVREYSSVLLRRSVRDGAKVGKQTLANLSMLPTAAVEALRAALAGKTLVEADEQCLKPVDERREAYPPDESEPGIE